MVFVRFIVCPISDNYSINLTTVKPQNHITKHQYGKDNN